MKYFAEKKFEGGKPNLYINGKKSIPMIFCLSDFHAADPMTAYAQKNIKAFGEKGIDLVQIHIFLHKTWHKITPFSVEYLKGEMSAVLRANPNAGIILRLHLSPPYWWLRDNPDEVCVYGEGESYRDNGEDSERLIKDDAENFLRVSLASEKWKKEAGEQVKKMLAEIAKYEEGDHLVGIHVACGVYGEWHQWGFGSYQPDYGKCMTHYFRKWLKEKYVTDENLQKAWKNATVTIDKAELAPPESRCFDRGLDFRVPGDDVYAVDSLRALQRSVSNAIEYFAEIIKSAWERPILVGTFYGYVDNWYQSSVGGHLDAEYLSTSTFIDYWSAPFMYSPQARNPGGVAIARGLLESARLNGILWLTEMDSAPLGTENFVGGDPARNAESVALLRRNVLEPFSKGMGMWYFDHRIFAFLSSAKNNGSIYEKFGWWDSEVMMNEIGFLQKVVKTYASLEYHPEADVLVVYDSEYYYYAPGNSIMSGTIFPEWYLTLGKSGVAYDSIYLHDIEKAEINRYKCVIFYNAIRLTEDKRKFIKERICTENRHVVWINAIGYLDDEGKDLALVKDVTGFDVGIEDTNYTDIKIIKNGKTISADGSFVSQFFIEDDANTVKIAEYANGRTAGAMREYATYISWQFMLPPLDIDLLRTIFSTADIHFYSDGGQALLVGAGMIIVTSEVGEVVLHLKNGKHIHDHFDKATTAIYDLESGERGG